jgi:hypothetical protein
MASVKIMFCAIWQKSAKHAGIVKPAMEKIKFPRTDVLLNKYVSWVPFLDLQSIQSHGPDKEF